MKNNAEKEKRPILLLAPMADVTDAAFRKIIAKYGKPDAMWTEFVSADGLMLADKKGKEKLLKDLAYDKEERPIIAQLFGANPETMEEAAALVNDLGFDGLDINMGCPDRSVEKQGAGAALIKNPKLAREIIRAAKRGAKNIPVSVKTRLGYNKDELETWLSELLAEDPAAITVHARTRKEMSKVPAKWERVRRAVEIRDEVGSGTLIFGNGDVADIAAARAKSRESGADGAMLGRAIFGNPYLFNDKQTMADLDIQKRLGIMVEHTRLFEELLGDTKSFAIMKKHYKCYVTGWDGAKELRVQLFETNNSAEVEKVVQDYLKL
ncbi:MAG: hypothetical protein A3G52_03100 [Candidatus Taylorbacteria bacterium RIFCSPLOWO2_12_FULL_43_20]|uniref:tRNA-dihydrouridine synthase n=1 Tax=Candidatus Taylorbacteria bacterium RIFCSPLOWO2_12_FULL_43_20 TaxID=1802332 RepID=A0A1G2P3F7_9BACT|nr:MAG: hypothetical protein A2825_03745 [Candidatus Taylorbacteria bacterium RIFCSPHIGHO2_01_FULL_43_120]OHA22093.1 MAG: hypothetical protein A3B98_04130 [Candidatus Taylorbacteria bacterium RIFCSPHIGHO2_02_FULL_43_55]OHA30399.1 MAG: hypothetical protein A3E92_00645 [Candidatus Taylorbacteria bacterium RIFCSPHIGHO2_12_FULL_42_34]OHA31064.1 MAG: hypothetical protein A3B09_04075 [Candidatus Taylorbacteria bacterium RIFCSPLOWO2_01_FULL_43_83]OHA39771.1 MAG: hypothetical protein A3H58_04725 [Candi